MRCKEFAGNAEEKAKEFFYGQGDPGTEAGKTVCRVKAGMTFSGVCLVVVGKAFFYACKHRQKAHITIHVPVQVAMDNVIMTSFKELEHRPKVFQRMMKLIWNLETVDTGFVESFQNLLVRFVLVQQIKVNIAHTGTVVQDYLFRASAYNPVKHLTNAFFLSSHCREYNKKTKLSACKRAGTT